THIAAGAAVVGIRSQEGATPVAVDSARDTLVSTKAGYARDGLVGRRRGTLPATASAVVDVIVEIGAMAAAAALSGSAADVAAARSADAAGVAVARPTNLETLRLPRLIAALAEGLARVAPRPGGCHPQGAQDSSGKHGPQPAQRFAARHRLGQPLREFVEQVVHDGFLSC